jgi:hypothetical protein
LGTASSTLVPLVLRMQLDLVSVGMVICLRGDLLRISLLQ